MTDGISLSAHADRNRRSSRLDPGKKTRVELGGEGGGKEAERSGTGRV
jgi:hypothetical protein